MTANRLLQLTGLPPALRGAARGAAAVVLLLVAPMLLSACAAYSFALPAPEHRQMLAAIVEADSTDAGAASRLAVARLLDGDVEGARMLLERTVELVPSDPAVPILLALAHEAGGRIGAAVELYEAYGREQIGSLAGLAAARSEAARPDAFREEARRLLIETSGAVSPVDPRQVLVMPFAHPAEDREAEDASAVLPMLLKADFDRRDLRTVDPQRVRIFLEEMGVEPERFADIPLGAEIGRSLGAGLVIQGVPVRTGTDSAALNLTVIRIAEGAPDSVTQAALASDVSRLGDASRQISTFVMQLLEGRPQSLVLFGPASTAQGVSALYAGRSARALDAGDAASARAFAEEALALESGLRVAAELRARAELVLRAEAIPFEATVLEAARLGDLQRAVMFLRADPESAHHSALEHVGRRDRVLASDLLGLDRVQTGVLLEVTFGGGS